MIFNLSYLKLAWLLLKLLIFYVGIFESHQLTFSLLALALSCECLFFSFYLLHDLSLLLEDLFGFAFIWDHISHFIIELSLCFHFLIIDLLGSKQILDSILVFLFVLLSLLGTWQLFDEEDVNYLHEFILYEIVVKDIENFGWERWAWPVFVLLTTDNLVIEIFLDDFL